MYFSSNANLFFAIEFLKSDNFLLFFIVFSLCPFQYSWQHFYWYNILYNLVSLLYMSWRLTHHGKKGLDRCFLDIPFLILALLRWLSESMSSTLNMSNKYLSIYLLGLLSRVQFFLFDFSVFCNLDRLRIFQLCNSWFFLFFINSSSFNWFFSFHIIL